jgi:hypothetical protein
MIQKGSTLGAFAQATGMDKRAHDDEPVISKRTLAIIDNRR